MRYVEDFDRGMKEETFRHWSTIRQPFLSEEAEKNLRLLVTDIILFHQLNYGGIDCSTMQFHLRTPPQNVPTTWTCKSVIAFLRGKIALEARKFNDERSDFNSI